MNHELKHDLGYWSSILGFSIVVLAGLFYSYISLTAEIGVLLVVLGFLIFIGGAELALRNQKHVESRD